MKTPALLTLLLLAALALAPAHAAEKPDLAPIKKWIARQDDFRTVQADFVQTRTLRTVRKPLSSPGRVWFVAAPSLLRWELGEPAKTVVIRKGETYHLIEPAKKKAERVSAAGLGKKGAGQMLAIMSFPLAKNFDEFLREYEVLAVEPAQNRCHLELAPRDPQARKIMNALRIDFDQTTGALIVFELVFRDGSSMRNDFSNVRINQKLDRRVFNFDLSGYEVIERKE